MEESFKEYAKLLRDGGDKFPSKHVVAKHRDEVFAALRKVQYFGCLHKLPEDMREFVEDVNSLLNKMDNESGKSKPAAIPSAFGAPIEHGPCGYCGSKRGTHSGPETGGHEACIECGGI